MSVNLRFVILMLMLVLLWYTQYFMMGGAVFIRLDIPILSYIKAWASLLLLNQPLSGPRCVCMYACVCMHVCIYVCMPACQGQPNALFCADEVFCGRAAHRGTETCAVVEAMASLELVGGRWAGPPRTALRVALRCAAHCATLRRSAPHAAAQHCTTFTSYLATHKRSQTCDARTD